MFSSDSKGGALDGSPKTMFILGLAVGVGGMAIIGLGFMMSMFFGGNAGTLLAANPTGNNAPNPSPSAAAAANPAALPDPVASEPPPVDEADHVRGNPNAAVTLIEYSDFECPFCLRHHDETLQTLLSEYPNDVRLVYRHFPLSFHPEAQKAAEASECAAEQGKFWEMHDMIFAANAEGNMGVARWKQFAADLGLNTSQFNDCLDTGAMAERVAQDLNEGSLAGVGGTPGTFVNGRLVEGAVPLATFEQLVTALGAAS